MWQRTRRRFRSWSAVGTTAAVLCGLVSAAYGESQERARSAGSSAEVVSLDPRHPGVPLPVGIGPVRREGDSVAVGVTARDCEAAARVAVNAGFRIESLDLPPAGNGIDSGPAALGAPVVTFDPALASSLERITEAKARELVGGLSGERPITIGGHYYWLTERDPDTVEAAEYSRERLDRQGLARGPEDGNVIGVREGEVRPSEVILVVAHLDADGGWPGADDNASGSAAVMLAAEALGRHKFERTIRFILFPEEFVDSGEYAERMFASGENLVAVINLDMVGNYDPLAGERRAIIFVGDPSDPTHDDETTIAQTFVDVAGAYSLDFTPLINETCG